MCTYEKAIYGRYTMCVPTSTHTHTQTQEVTPPLLFKNLKQLKGLLYISYSILIGKRLECQETFPSFGCKSLFSSDSPLPLRDSYLARFSPSPS